MSNLTDHARRELEAAGFFSEEGMYGSMLGEGAMELVEVFANQGHSGMSASVMANLVNKLFRFEPLGPLTGADEEWNETISGDGTLQNNRSSNVFKDGDRTYQIDYYIFREPYVDEETGETRTSTFTGEGSFKDVEFPYTPKHVYIDVPADCSDEDRKNAIAEYEAANRE